MGSPVCANKTDKEMEDQMAKKKQRKEIDLKITVKTPKGQAQSCMKTQKAALLGFKKVKTVKEEKMLNDHTFYWIVPAKNNDEMMLMNKRLVRGEMFIKRFYRSLFKIISRANRLATKFKKGAGWIRKWMLKRLRKQVQDGDDSDGLIQQISNMSDKEIIEFIKINDKKEMEKLLSGDLITTTILK